jgi:hypothetical protein
VWNPAKPECNARTETVSVTVSKVLPLGGTLHSSDYSLSAIADFEAALKKAGFAKTSAPKGLRYQRTRSGITAVVDIYGPHEFAGLDDTAHIDNFDQGINSHEVIVYNGHSMLGASDFWARPSIYKGTADVYLRDNHFHP